MCLSKYHRWFGSFAFADVKLRLIILVLRLSSFLDWRWVPFVLFVRFRDLLANLVSVNEFINEWLFDLETTFLAQLLLFYLLVFERLRDNLLRVVIDQSVLLAMNRQTKGCGIVDFYIRLATNDASNKFVYLFELIGEQSMLSFIFIASKSFILVVSFLLVQFVELGSIFYLQKLGLWCVVLLAEYLVVKNGISMNINLLA